MQPRDRTLKLHMEQVKVKGQEIRAQLQLLFPNKEHSLALYQNDLPLYGNV